MTKKGKSLWKWNKRKSESQREPQVKQMGLLVSPIYTGQAPREEAKHIKNKKEPRLGLSFWVSLPSCLESVPSFACQIKLSYKGAGTLIPFQIFAVRQNWANYTLPGQVFMEAKSHQCDWLNIWWLNSISCSFPLPGGCSEGEWDLRS